MVAYFTTLNDHKETHAHFLGMDNSFNNKYQLYLNILYDIIKVGIESGASIVDFARTAPEIKSSVGAEPHEMYIFVKHRNAFLNKFVNSVFKYLEPQRNIIYRSPFKNKGSQISQTQDGYKHCVIIDLGSVKTYNDFLRAPEGRRAIEHRT